MALTKAHNRMIKGAPVNVLDFGALGDGVTDDTAAIQAALDASLTVHVPTGTYLVSTTLTFPSNQIIYGTGRQSIIKSTNTSGGICMQTDAIALGNLDNLTIRNLRITGAGSSSGGGAGLWLNDASRWYLEDVLIDQHGGIGLIVQDWAWIGEAHHCGFVNNGSHGVQTLMPEVSGAVFSLEFVSCMASGNGGNGYNINDSPTTDGNVFNIIGGSIEQNVVGVKIQRTRAISVDGVYFESNSAKAIEITGMASLGTAMIRNIGGGGLTEIFVDSGSVVIDGVMVYETGQVIHITSESNYDVKNFILSPSDTLDPPYIKEIGSRNRGINASGNLLRNGNFIGWLWEQDQPSHWSTLGTATYARSTPPTGCSGDAMTITAGSTIAGVRQIISNLAVGSVVTVSAWIKASSGDTAVLKLVDNGEGQVRVLEVTSTDWKRYTIQHLLSAGSSELQVQLYGKANTDIGYFAEVQSTTHTDLKGWLSNPLDIREIAISNTVQNLDQGATPIVEGVTLCKTMDTVTVTDMLNGVVGQEITILFEHSKIITDNSNLILSGGANFSGTANDTLTLIQKADGNWYEKSRSVN